MQRIQYTQSRNSQDVVYTDERKKSINMEKGDISESTPTKKKGNAVRVEFVSSEQINLSA